MVRTAVKREFFNNFFIFFSPPLFPFQGQETRELWILITNTTLIHKWITDKRRYTFALQELIRHKKTKYMNISLSKFKLCVNLQNGVKKIKKNIALKFFNISKTKYWTYQRRRGEGANKAIIRGLSEHYKRFFTG